MKLALTIIFLELAVLANGQTLEDIEKRLRQLDHQVELTYDTTGFSALPKLDYDCDSENQNAWDFYHVIDLNNDGQKDLIYSGPCHPYYQTDIFLNNGLTLKKIHEYPGKIVSIEQMTDRTTVNVFKAFCCCDSFSDYIQVTIHNDSHVDINQITFEGNTQVTPDKLSKIKVVGTLRTSPELNDKKKTDNCSGEIIKGNHLADIGRLTTVVQLKQSGQWRLVLYPENETKSLIGWIKVKY